MLLIQVGVLLELESSRTLSELPAERPEQRPHLAPTVGRADVNREVQSLEPPTMHDGLTLVRMKRHTGGHTAVDLSWVNALS